MDYRLSPILYTYSSPSTVTGSYKREYRPVQNPYPPLNLKPLFLLYPPLIPRPLLDPLRRPLTPL